MQVSNNTGNTIYIDDLDLHLPYKNGEIETIDANSLKQSRCLRSFIISGMIDVVSYDKEERIENSIIYLRNKYNPVIQKPPIQQDEADVQTPELEKTTDDIEVKVHGIFLDASGYGKVNRNFALKLHEAGVKVKVDPKRSNNQLNETELAPIMKLQNTVLSRNHISIDSVIPSFGDISTGKYHILYTTIESYSIPKQFIECCHLYNEIWTISDWSTEILKKEINKPIYTVTTGVDLDLYTEKGTSFDLKPNVKDFVFISVFGWNYRKGYDVLLKSYFDEFSADDNVSLLIVSRYQGGHSKHHQNKIKTDIDNIMKLFPNKDLPHVVRYSKITPEIDMPKIYRAANAFVLPTRGESLCLPPLEASMCGLPVIMTNCSGQQQYLRQDNSYMLEIDKLSAAKQGQFHIHYWDGQIFPELTSEKTHNDLRKLMRTVFNNLEGARQKNKKLQQLIREKLTWNHTANLALARLKEIKQKL